MPEDHPDPRLLERFMRDEAGREERRVVVRHLLAGCGPCTQVTRRLWKLSEAQPQTPRELEDPDLETAGHGNVLRRLTERGPRHAAFALHRLALLLTEAGRGEEALHAIRKARPLYEHYGEAFNLLRLRHLEGRVEEALGSPQAAEAAYLEARQGFLGEGLGIEAAAALLDLALLYQRQGRSSDIRRLAEDLLPILRARDIRQGVAAALLFFRDLVETGRATPEALFAVSRYVKGPRRAGIA